MLADLLMEARSFIENESAYGRRFCAEDRFGREVPSASDLAVKFCIIGAIERASGDYNLKRDAREAIRDVIGGDRSIARFNQSADHCEALRIFDVAISQEAT